jgi:hypothetical protein
MGKKGEFGEPIGSWEEEERGSKEDIMNPCPSIRNLKGEKVRGVWKGEKVWSWFIGTKEGGDSWDGEREFQGD